jgi:flavin reductase (DIM6/NTAB) family NADH-FMN oxidoreductase RutF
MDFNLASTEKQKIYDLLCGLVAPRPIAWITSLNEAGQIDVAPFSAYNYVGTDPPIVAVGIANKPGSGLIAKTTANNIRSQGEFVVNVVNEALADAMNLSAIDFPSGIDKLALAHLQTEPSLIVKVPRIAQAPASLECREITTLEIGRNRIVLGQVVAIHLKDEFIDPAGPFVRAEALHAIGRMNGLGAYVKTAGAFFSIPRLTYEDWKQMPQSRRLLTQVAELQSAIIKPNAPIHY